jgi:hypothetical protein
MIFLSVVAALRVLWAMISTSSWLIPQHLDKGEGVEGQSCELWDWMDRYTGASVASRTETCVFRGNVRG